MAPGGRQIQIDEYDEEGNLIRKKRDMKDLEVLKRIIGLISRGKYRKYIIALYIIMIISAIIGYVNPLIFQRIINDGLGEGDISQANLDVLFEMGGILAVIMVIGFLTWIGQQFLIQFLSINVMYEMRSKLFENLQKLSFDYYDSKDRSTGKIISYITNDVNTIQELIGSGLLNLFGNILSFGGSAILMFFISWQLSLASLGIIILILLVGLTILLRARKLLVIMRRKIAAVTGQLQESISGMRLIKQFAVEKDDYEAFDKVTDEELEISLKAQKLFSLIPGMVIFLLGSGMAVIIVLGAYLQSQNLLDIGSIFAFMLYLLQFFGPIAQIVAFINQIQNSMAAGERIIKLVDRKPTVVNRTKDIIPNEKGKIILKIMDSKRKASKELGKEIVKEYSTILSDVDDEFKNLLKVISDDITEIDKIAEKMEISVLEVMNIYENHKDFLEYKYPLVLEEVKGHIEFKNVKFSYVPDVEIIKGLNMEIKEKERVAIVGYTGAGKSTLINLLGRFYDINEGQILVDGYDLRDIKIQSLRTHMGIVLQDNFLFSGTVLDNIKYGKPTATEEEVMESAKKVGAHEFIMELPQGYHTEVEERGNLLSIGQKQLIAFARALIRDPPILILDEATSAVDPYSELIIQQALEVLLKDRTSISIAHRLSTIINSDRILTLKDGEIVEHGSHEELIKKKGLYYQLYTLQYKDAYRLGKEEIGS